VFSCPRYIVFLKEHDQMLTKAICFKFVKQLIDITLFDKYHITHFPQMSGDMSMHQAMNK
jgi:hypothetical protein